MRTDCQHSALGRLLLAKSQSGDVKTELKASEAKDARVAAELQQRAAEVPNLISIEHCTGSRLGLTDQPATDEPELGLRTAWFGRDLDLGWRRSSYTSITAEAHGSVSGPELVGSEPEETGTSDEPAGPAAPGRDETSASGAEASPGDEEVQRGATSLLSELPAGATFGTFVHRVLEKVDFTAPDLRSLLLEAINAEQTGYPEGHHRRSSPAGHRPGGRDLDASGRAGGRVPAARPEHRGPPRRVGLRASSGRRGRPRRRRAGHRLGEIVFPARAAGGAPRRLRHGPEQAKPRRQPAGVLDGQP